MMKVRLLEPLAGESPDDLPVEIIEDEMAAFRKARAAL